MLARCLHKLAGRRFLLSCLHTSRRVQNSHKIVENFKLADIGEGITECEIIRWNVKPQAAIQAFDPLCEVQSDKASVEITSPFDGVVTELLVQEGQVAKVGSDLCLIEVVKETASGSSPSIAEPVNVSSISDSNTLATADSNTNEQNAKSSTTSTNATRSKHPMDPTFTPDAESNLPVFATPSVRHFARQRGVDLSQLAPGSGRDGRIEKRDIDKYMASAITTERPVPSQDGQDVVVELGKTRYGMWKAMEKSLQIPHFGYSTTLDLTTLHDLLPVLNANIPPHFLPPLAVPTPTLTVSPSSVYPPFSPPEVPSSGQYTRLTYLPFLLKTLAKSMLDWPLFRASITPTTDSPSKPTLTIRSHSDISVALSTPNGLYTPTIQSADTYSMYAISSQLKHLSHLGRQTPCGLTPKEMPKRGGTLTVSNVGAIGAGDFAAPVLVPGGGVAIVALGRAKWVWDVERGDGTGERRLKLGVSWSADHRVVEGAELAAFVECWRGYVENPARLIADSV
ncbi:2-oxoacid dehydrogenases acyltransferase-domain-containing protein [Lentinula aciculospora]|uniref:Dihydrolipoamide acetyltransferase component of pyruvate dehydrogenase complex n=1 Tax=Lentinula aciculospora TaxID=153920 RepID=A0A9W9ASA8_9AGAR|nr:2-oxoacid dehydrogenases acyltransferase-domain-containing protein [Lentinula aciculospora]